MAVPISKQTDQLSRGRADLWLPSDHNLCSVAGNSQRKSEPGDPMTVRLDRLLVAGGSGFSQTVDRALVHRRSIAEVYVTGYVKETADRFVVFGQWPRYHRIYCSGGRYHPTLLMETMRQAVLAICHGLLGVPIDRQFVMSRITADGLHRMPDVGPDPTDVTLHVTRTPGRGNRRSHWSMRIHVGTGVEVSGGGDLVVLTDPQYVRIRRGRAGRLRAATPTTPVDPAVVGRVCTRDVVLAGSTDGLPRLHVDQSHPIFYDHPLDHVPGSLLLEASLQQAHAHDPAFRPDGVDAHFGAFIEPDRPCIVECDPAPPSLPGGLVIGFRQSQTVKSHVTLSA